MLIHSHEIIWCIRRTHYIPRFGGVLKECGILLGVCLTCEELVGGGLVGDDGVGFMGDYCSIHSPFTTFSIKFPFLSYTEMFQGSFSLNSPTYFSPLRKVLIPLP